MTSSISEQKQEDGTPRDTLKLIIHGMFGLFAMSCCGVAALTITMMQDISGSVHYTSTQIASSGSYQDVVLSKSVTKKAVLGNGCLKENADEQGVCGERAVSVTTVP
jgi:hypothetical protein